MPNGIMEHPLKVCTKQSGCDNSLLCVSVSVYIHRVSVFIVSTLHTFSQAQEILTELQRLGDPKAKAILR